MKNPLKDFNIAVTGTLNGNKPEDIKKWVEANGGKWHSTVTPETTHLLCSDKAFENRVTSVLAAVKFNKAKIVTYDWLEDSLMNRGRKREGPYLLQKQKQIAKKVKHEAKAASKASPKSLAKAAAKAKEKKATEEDGLPHLCPLQDLTDTVPAAIFEAGCMSAKAELASSMSSHIKELKAGKAAKAATAKAARKAYLESKRDAERKKKNSLSASSTSAEPAHALDLALSAPPGASSESLVPPTLTAAELATGAHEHEADTPNPDNHHIYRDATGFDYDIVLTRIAFVSNTHERYAVRMYESHTRPRTYALHVRFTRSHALPIMRILAPIGSSYADTFEVFERFFRAKTRLHWEQRLQRELRDVVSEEYLDGYGGEEVCAKMGIISCVKSAEVPLGCTRRLPFEYRAPMEGPKGVLVEEGVVRDSKEPYATFDI